MSGYTLVCITQLIGLRPGVGRGVERGRVCVASHMRGGYPRRQLAGPALVSNLPHPFSPVWCVWRLLFGVGSFLLPHRDTVNIVGAVNFSNGGGKRGKNVSAL